MNDRELLELAAKAAGINVGEWIEIGVHSGFTVGNGVRPNGICWNPLTDDGDALRLAVDLEMLVEVEGHTARAVVKHGDHEAYNTDGDTMAATRRAIVRAAAEIGRAMK